MVESRRNDARIMTAVVEAACKAVELAISYEFFEITIWLLDRDSPCRPV